MEIPKHLLSWKTPMRYHISRRRVLDAFEQAASAKVVLLNAPAGYGKTSAVVDLIQHMRQPVAWYPLEFLDHPTTFDFVWNFVRAIQQVVPTFGSLLDQLFQERAACDITDVLLPAIINELTLLSEPIMITLDNYHRIASQEINDTLIYLIERSPDNVRFVVTTRSLPDWPARWTTESQAVTLTEAELAFTRDECLSLAASVGVQLSQHDHEEIFSQIGGWPILHALIYTSMRGLERQPAINILHTLSMPSSMVYQYLAREVLNKEAPWAQDALRKTAVLQEIDGAMCEILLEVQNGDVVLSQLATSVFLRPFVAGGKRYYIHSHEIMRTFLLEELSRVHSYTEVNQLYKRVAEVMEARDALDQAISYYCRGQFFDQAARMIRERGPYLVSSIDLQRLEMWLAQIPKHVLERDPTLLVYQGIVLTNTERALADIPLYKARDLFIAQKDVVQRRWVEGELAWWFFIQGQFKEGLSYLKPALEEPDLPLERRARLMQVMAHMVFGGDDFSTSLWYTEQAAQLYRLTHTHEGKMALVRVLRHLSGLHFMQGRMRDALRALDESVQLSTALKLGNLSLAWINNFMAVVYQHLACFDEAFQCLAQAEALLEAYPTQSQLRMFILINKGHMYREIYNDELAEACYFQAQRDPSDGVFMALRMVQPERAGEVLPRALKGWQRSRSFEGPIDTAKYDVVVGVIYLSMREYQQAQHFLEQGDAVLTRHKAWFFVATVRFYLAKLYLQIGKVARAHICLNSTLSELKNNSYYSLDIWQPWVVSELCAYAIEHDIEATFAEELVIKRIDKRFITPFLTLLIHSDQRVRNQAIRILASTGDTIRLHAYQLLEECNDGSIRERIRGHLQSNWLSAAGLIRLKSFLSWRQVDIFLFWISPAFRGSPGRIAKTAFIVRGTVNDHIDQIRIQLQEILAQDLGGRGAHVLALNWAISEGIIDPYKSHPFEYNT